MKIAVFSDVHGNIHAFEKVYERLRALKADRYVFCGDLCGYYYFQNEVVDMLSSLKPLTAVIGNHDRSYLDCLDGGLDPAGDTERYGSSLRSLLQNASPKTTAFVRGLEESHVDPAEEVAVFHGSPWDPEEEYVYPWDPLDRFKTLPYRFVLLGHTHHAMARKAGPVNVVNPGSCGQPRDSMPPSYAVVDTDTQEVSIERVPYDPRPMIEEIRRRNETFDYLEKVLLR